MTRVVGGGGLGSGEWLDAATLTTDEKGRLSLPSFPKSSGTNTSAKTNPDGHSSSSRKSFDGYTF